MRKQLLTVIGLLFAAAACGSSPNDTPAAPTPAPTPASIATAPATEPGVTVSDAVPPIQELRDAGLTTEQAECFIATIDPDGDGTVNIELFAEALGCQ